MADDEKRSYPLKARYSTAMAEFGLELGEFQKRRNHGTGAHGEQSEPEGAAVSLRDILSTVFTHKWKIVLLSVISAVAAVMYVAKAPTGYESEARLLVGDDRTELAIDPSGEGDTFLKGTRGSAGDRVRSELAIMQSVSVAERAVDRVGAERVVSVSGQGGESGGPVSPEDRGFASRALIGVLKSLNLQPDAASPRDLAIRKLIKSFAAEPTASSSNVIRLTYVASRPDVARETLQAILDAYLEKHIELNKTRVSPEFFREQADKSKAELDAKEGALEQLSKQLNVVSLERQRELLLEQLNTLEPDLRRVDAGLSASQARVVVLEKTLQSHRDDQQSSVAPAGADATMDATQARLLDLSLQEADLKTRYKPGAQPLLQVRAQIEALQKILEARKGATARASLSLDPATRDLAFRLEEGRADLAGQTAEREKLGGEIDNLRQSLATLNSHENEVKSLQREVAVLENEYLGYANSLHTAEISAAFDQDRITNVGIVQAATLPSGTNKNIRKLLALMVFLMFLGPAGGVALAFGLEYLDHSLKTSEDVERRLGLPVLIALPHAKQPMLQVRRDSHDADALLPRWRASKPVRSAQRADIDPVQRQVSSAVGFSVHKQ